MGAYMVDAVEDGRARARKSTDDVSATRVLEDAEEVAYGVCTMQSADVVPKTSGRAQPRGGSRKGRPNKISKIIKVEVLESFGMVGGRHYLARQAEANPVAYMGLLARVLPQQVRSEVEGLTVVVQSIASPAVPVSGVLASPIAEHVWREPPLGSPPNKPPAPANPLE